MAHGGADELVDVVIEVAGPSPEHTAPGPSRSARAAALGDAFARAAGPVERAVEAAGGVVTGRAWVNGTVRARVPAAALETLAALDGVVSLGPPRPLAPDDG
ncbi:MAG: hypothetical protein ACLGI2_03720 [Acidimicrobiia bacterium]